jgi:hypothetical protein
MSFIITLLIEAICVGIYTTLVYSVLTSFIYIRNEYSQLLIVGFFKHFLARIIGLHKAYCKYKRWKNVHVHVNTSPHSFFGRKDMTFKLFQYIFNKKNIVLESVCEGLMFFLLGYVLINVFNVRGHMLYFCIGFLLHLGAEIAGLHTAFCETY